MITIKSFNIWWTRHCKLIYWFWIFKDNNNVFTCIPEPCDEHKNMSSNDSYIAWWKVWVVQFYYHHYYYCMRLEAFVVWKQYIRTCFTDLSKRKKKMRQVPTVLVYLFLRSCRKVEQMTRATQHDVTSVIVCLKQYRIYHNQPLQQTSIIIVKSQQRKEKH